MTWVKLDDNMPDHPKIREAGALSMAVYVAGLAYCARHLTDGFIPEAVVMSLVNFEDVLVLHRDKDDAPEPYRNMYKDPPDDTVPGLFLGWTPERFQVVDPLVSVGLWDRDPDGRGFWVHDYLDYNFSREQVMAEREAAKKRMAAARAEGKGKARRSKNVRTNTDGTSPEVPQPRRSPNPEPVPDPEPLTRDREDQEHGRSAFVDVMEGAGQ